MTTTTQPRIVRRLDRERLGRAARLEETLARAEQLAQALLEDGRRTASSDAFPNANGASACSARRTVLRIQRARACARALRAEVSRELIGAKNGGRDE